MKKLLLAVGLIITLASNKALSQISRSFILPDIEKNIDIDIDLYKSGVYEIGTSEYITDDMLGGCYISYGNYTLENENLILTDIYNGLKMQFEYHTNYIFSKQTFKCISNKKIYSDGFELYNSPGSSYNEIKPLEEDRLENKQLNSNEYSLLPGIYKNNDDFCLTIQSNKKYIFKYKKMILSEGVWDRKGNELNLFDEILNHTFYVIIKDKVIVSKILPISKNCIFYKK